MSAWSRALTAAAQTPPSRNRYVDFLRAVSIGAVVLGHWIIAAPWTLGGIAAAGGIGVRGVVVTGTMLGAWLLGAIGPTHRKQGMMSA